MPRTNLDVIITAKDRASGKFKGVGRSAGGLKSALLGVGKAAGVAALALGAAAAAAGVFAVKSAAQMEQFRVSFDTMIGDAEIAKKTLSDLSDFAAKTPFELPEVVQAGKQLLAFGFTADEVIPKVKSLGDVAAGLGVPMDRLILNFGQVKAQGRLTGRELRDFAIAGVPLLAELADMLGKSKEEITNMVSAGEIGFPIVEQAFDRMTGEGGRFFNLMDKQSKTFSGIISNMKDEIGRLARSIIGISETGEIREGSIFFFLKKGAESLVNFLNANKGNIIAFFNGLTKNLTNVTEWAVNAFKGIKKFLTETGLGKAIVAALNDVLNQSARLWKQLRLFYMQNRKEINLLAKVIGGALLVGLLIFIRAAATTIRVLAGIAKIVRIVISWIGKLNNALRTITGVSAITGAISAIRGRRQIGGPVTSGQPFLVGEQGPELFVPSQSGNITPNSKLGEGGVTVNIYGNINNERGETPEKISQMVGREIQLALQGAR